MSEESAQSNTTERRTLVLGAGASNPYGFPLGRQLRDHACWQLRHDSTTPYKALCALGHTHDDVTRFVEELSHSARGSIDSFLATEPEWMEIGKAAIAAILLDYEKSSKLFPGQNPGDSWYEWLANTILAPEYQPRSINIVTFNYDRSLEHYLEWVVRQRERLEESDARA